MMQGLLGISSTVLAQVFFLVPPQPCPLTFCQPTSKPVSLLAEEPWLKDVLGCRDDGQNNLVLQMSPVCASPSPCNQHTFRRAQRASR